MVKSAASRSSIGEARSLVSAIMTICPISELIGPSIGWVFGGKLPRARFNRSLTSCRLRYTSPPHSNST
jgi:hypothetical protein